MNKDLVISSNHHGFVVAILENDRLLEIHRKIINENFSVGDIYIGIVKKISKNLNAAFISIGNEKDAFLHYQDLGPNIRLMIKFVNSVETNNTFFINAKKFNKNYKVNRLGHINQILQIGQKILVQINKESIANKGPRLVSEISIPGKYLILIPFDNKIYISKKIKDIFERKRILNIIKIIKHKNYGIIIRTAAVTKNIKTLKSDLIFLLNKWKIAINNFIKKNYLYNIFSENDKAYSILRDNFNVNCKSITCDDKKLYKNICTYISIIYPNKNILIKFYKNIIPIYEKYGIEQQIKFFLGKNVPIAKGAYLIVEHTEALHVIDVNSGIGVGVNKILNNISTLDINIMAANEVVKQIILRDMGGIIIVDFIDMDISEENKYLFFHLKKMMKQDQAKHKILPISKFGLVEITRQRNRPEVNIITNEINPNNVYGIVPPLIHIKNIEYILENIIMHKNFKKIFLHIDPFIYAYIKSGFFSIKLYWLIKYKIYISLIPRYSFKYLEYKIFNEKNILLSYYKNN